MIFGGDGGDLLIGGDGDDGIEGGFGSDQIFGDSVQVDELGMITFVTTGAEGNDFLNGNAGNDILWGQAGDDTLTGGKNRDETHGGDGWDTINWTFGDGIDAPIDGGVSALAAEEAEQDTFRLFSLEGEFDDVISISPSSVNPSDVVIEFRSGVSSSALLMQQIERFVIDAGEGGDTINVDDLRGATVSEWMSILVPARSVT